MASGTFKQAIRCRGFDLLLDRHMKPNGRKQREGIKVIKQEFIEIHVNAPAKEGEADWLSRTSLLS